MENHDVDPNYKDASGNTPLLVAARIRRADIVQFLLHNGANNWNRQYTLAMLIAHKDYSALRTLVNGGLDVDLRIGPGTQLLLATAKGGFQLAEELLNAGANVNAQWSNSGRTPLMMVVSLKNYKLINLLLKRGADIYSRDSYGNNVFDIAKFVNSNTELLLLRVAVNNISP